MSQRSRRNFLKTVGAVTAAAPTLLRAQTRNALRRGSGQGSERVAASDRIRLAAFGIGIRGQQDIRSAVPARAQSAELVAAADVYDGRLTLARELRGNLG